MGIQNNWRWCNKCQALTFAGSPTLGECPAGGQHDHTGSGDYALIDNDAAVPGQDNWRWCNKCQALAYAGAGSVGACSAGGVHDHTGSGNYVLGSKDNGPTGQENWRWCNKCQELTFAGNASLGSCAAGGTHDHTGSGNYVLSTNKKKTLDVICDDVQCVSVKAVYKNIANRLNGKVVGYACFIGQSLTFQAYGNARTAADAPAKPFLSSTKMPVASVSKVVTALAAIRILDQHNLSLDAAIGPYFPADWTLGTNVAAITFRELLTHTSGINNYGNTPQDYADLQQFFSTITIDPANKVPFYSNYNFSVFRILLPIIDGFVDDPANRPAKLAAAYIKIVQTNVFEPVGVVGADAKPPASGPQATGYAYSYAFPGTSQGWDWKDDTLSVGAAGWYLSVEDLAHVLVSLNKDDGLILTDAQLQAMLPRPKPLGWDVATGYRYIEKNGGWGWNGTSLSTSIAIFGPGVIGVLFINSDISGEPGVGADTVLREAYMKALTPRP